MNKLKETMKASQFLGLDKNEQIGELKKTKLLTNRIDNMEKKINNYKNNLQKSSDDLRTEINIIFNKIAENKNNMSMKNIELNNNISKCNNMIKKLTTDTSNMNNKLLTDKNDLINKVFENLKLEITEKINNTNSYNINQKNEIFKLLNSFKQDINIIKQNRDESYESLIRALTHSIKKLNEKIKKVISTSQDSYTKKIKMIQELKKEINKNLNEDTKKIQLEENTLLDFLEKILSKYEN